MLAKRPCVFKSFQVDKLGVEFKLKTSPALLITPYYLEDDNSQSYDYSQMAEEKLKEEIKSPRFFDEESVS